MSKRKSEIPEVKLGVAFFSAGWISASQAWSLVGMVQPTSVLETGWEPSWHYIVESLQIWSAASSNLSQLFPIHSLKNFLKGRKYPVATCNLHPS